MVAALLAVLFVMFVVLNFVVGNAGTLLVILAVACGVGAGVLLSRSRR